MILNSAMQAHDLIARVLVERDDVAWIEDPCYPNLRAVLSMAGIRVVPFAVDAEGLAIESTAGERKAACADFRHAVMPISDRRRHVARASSCAAAGCGAVAGMDRRGRPPGRSSRGRRGPAASIFSLDRGARTLYAGTFSHTVFPSLRLAYVVLPQSLVDVFHAVRRQLDDHTHGYMQAVLADFIAGGHFSAHLRRMRALYAARRDALIEAFARHAPDSNSAGPACGMHATLEWHAGRGDADAAASAARAGIRVQPLSRYSAARAAQWTADRLFGAVRTAHSRRRWRGSVHVLDGGSGATDEPRADDATRAAPRTCRTGCTLRRDPCRRSARCASRSRSPSRLRFARSLRPQRRAE